jgi:hypothetical protein
VAFIPFIPFSGLFMSKNLIRSARSVRPREVFAGFALVAISVIVASCNGDTTGPGAVDTPITLPKQVLSTLLCKATPATQTLSCSETPDALGNVLPSYMLGASTDGLETSKIIIGGQNANIKLTSSNIVNNTTTHDFSFDVNVKNLRPQAIGTVNGTTTDSSLSVFFQSGPTTSGGTGTTTVSNPSGISSFTGPNQPYFQYKEMVAQNGTSANKNWVLHYDPTVTSFTFLLLVSANVKYPQGYIDVFPNPGGVSVSATLQMTDSVRDPLGYLHGDQSETWSLSDSTRASINASGLLTGLANGPVVVTATQGPRTGSATITVSGGVTPTAIVDSSAANSAPGSAYHVALNTQYVLAAPGILSNDTPGNPAGTVSTFGADSIGGVVTDHVAGSTVSPLPGHADGSLTVGSNGSLTFTPPTGFIGYYAFHYRNTNSNGSTTALVRISVGVRPSAGNSTYSPNLLGNVKINTSTSTNTKVNGAGDGITFHFVSNTNGTANLHADGTYDFNPAVGYTGPASFVYNVSNGFGTSTNGTVSFTVASRIWFVADSAGGTGDGRYGSPLKCMVGATNCLSGVTLAANDIVHVAPGTYANTAGFTLTSGMKMIGQGASGVFADATNANVTWPADAGAQPGTAGARPVLNSSGVAVLVGGGGNLIRGFLIGSTTGASLSGSTTGGMTIGSLAIVNPTGRAILLTGAGSLTANIDSVVATGGTGNGIDLQNQTGVFSSGITKITDPSGNGINVISSGGFSFGNTIVRKKNTAGIGVNLSTNTGTTTFTSLIDSSSAGPTMITASAGTIAIGGGSLNSIGGIAIDATSTAFSGAGFSEVKASGYPGSGVNLNAVTGTLAMGTGFIIGGSGAGITVTTGSSVTLTYSGTITAGTGRPVRIDNGGSAAACPTATLSGNITSTANGILVQSCNSGTIVFSGASKLLKTTTNKGVQLASNTGATINFTNGGLVDSTTTGAAFEATGGGTVSVTGTGNILNATTGGALNVTSTTIGASGLTFKSISANGGSNGIVLNATGSGGLTVTGDGAQVSGLYTRNGTGGTIQNTTGAGVNLTSANNVTLRQMNLVSTNSTHGVTAVNGAVTSSGGSNITLSALSIDSPGEHGWGATNLGGVNAFDNNSRVQNWQTSQANGISFVNTSSNFTSFTIDHTLFTTSATGAAGVNFNSNGTTTGGSVTVTSSEFTLIDQNAVQINNNASGTLTALVQKNNFHDADATSGDGNNTLYLTNSGSGQLNFTVGGPLAADGNTFKNLARLTVLAGVLQVDAASVGTSGTKLNGSIQNNTISNDVGFVNGRRAIDVQIEASSSTHGGHSILIANNTVTNVSKQGLSMTWVSVAGGDILNNNFTIKNNTFTNVGTEGAVDSGSGMEFETNVDVANTGANLSANILIESNTVQNSNTSGVGSTIEVNNRPFGGNNTSLMNFTIRGNVFTNNSAGEVLEILNSAGDGTGLPNTCVDLNSDNTLANNAVGGNGTGFKLTNNAGTFAIEGLGANTPSAFLGPRNQSNGVSPATITTVGTITSSAGCTTPP